MSRETEDLVRKVLAERGHTKITLANTLSIDWEEVDRWMNGAEEPSPEQVKQLEALLHE